MPRKVICPGCGHRQMLDDAFPRLKVRCPACGVMCPVPEPTPAEKPRREDEEDVAARLLREVAEPATPRQPAPKKVRAPTPPPPPPAPGSEDDDNGQPYIMEGGEDRKCPGCH